MLGVDAGVDHEADRAPHVGLQAAVVGVGVLVEADLLAQPLGVERPALGVGGVVGLLAEGGQAGQLLLDGDLQVMAGDSLVVGDGLDIGQRAVGEVVGVDIDLPGRLPSGVPWS